MTVSRAWCCAVVCVRQSITCGASSHEDEECPAGLSCQAPEVQRVWTDHSNCYLLSSCADNRGWRCEEECCAHEGARGAQQPGAGFVCGEQQQEEEEVKQKEGEDRDTRWEHDSEGSADEGHGQSAHESPRADCDADDKSRVFTAVVCSVLASVVCWYCWTLYGTAAELQVVKPGFLSPATRALARTRGLRSAVGYFRLVAGSFLFGHLGDTCLGRWRVLAWCVMLVGASTATMALIRGCQADMKYSAVLRCIQGVGMGGQWAGSALVALESRGFATRSVLASCLTQTGVWLGACIGVLACLGAYGTSTAITNTTDHTTSPSHTRTRTHIWWCGQLAFACGGAFASLIGLYMLVSTNGRRVARCETASRRDFQRMACPCMTLYHEQTLTMVVVCLLVVAAYVYVVCLLYFSWEPLLQSSTHRADGLLSLAVACLIVAGWTLASGLFSVRCGHWVDHRKLFVSATVFSGGAIWLWLWFLGLGRVAWWLLLGFCVSLGPAVGVMQGLLPTVLADIFSPNARYSGASITLHVTTFVFAATFPSATSALRSAGHHQPRLEVFEERYNAFSLAMAGTVVCTLSALSAWYMLCSRFVPFGLQPLHMRECVQVSFERSDTSRHRARGASRHRHNHERRGDGHQEEYGG